MYTVFPWMFDLCHNNHKMACLYAYIFSCSMGGQSFVYNEDSFQDIWDYCRLNAQEAKYNIDAMISQGILEMTPLGLVTTLGFSEEEHGT